MAVSPTWPEDVLILGGREAWSNQGLVKWIFLGSLWKMRQPCRCTAQIALQENLPWGVQLAVSPQLLHPSDLPWTPHGLSSAFTWRPRFLPAAPIQCWAQRGCQSQAVSAHSGPSNRQSLCGECGSQSPRQPISEPLVNTGHWHPVWTPLTMGWQVRHHRTGRVWLPKLDYKIHHTVASILCSLRSFPLGEAVLGDVHMMRKWWASHLDSTASHPNHVFKWP